MNDVMTSAADADTIIDLLDTERAALLAVVDSIPLERRTQRMDLNRWSVVEVLEHVSRVDGGVTRIITSRAQEPLIGPITVRGWVELVAHHDARHALQIAEIAAQA
jgi:hypothetical protein